MTKATFALGLAFLATGFASAESTTRVKNLKILAVIYRGTSGTKDWMDDHTVQMAKNGLELGRGFYFRNSRARLNVEFTWLVADGVAPRNEGPTMDYIEQDLRARGVKDGEYDGVVVTGTGLLGNFGGFTLLGGAGGCFGSGDFAGTGYPGFDPDTGYGWAWIFAHEFQHALDLVIVEGSGLKMLSDHPYSDHNEPFFRGCYLGGEHWDWVALTFREFDDYLQIKGVRNDFLTCTDADGDGLPDDDARLPADEKRFGSDPGKKDADGDGLDDLGEFTADRFGGSDPHRPDTDGDGLKDDVDPYPVVAIRPTLEYRPLTTNSTANAAEAELPRLLDSVFARDDAGGAIGVHAAWNEEALQFAFRGPRKFSVEMKLDGTASNGFWEGGDTYVMRIAEDKAEFNGLGLHGPVPVLQKTAAEIEGGYCLAVNISAKLGQGVSKEINYGGPREPNDVANGLTLVAGRSIAFNFIYKFDDGTEAVLTPNHAMYATRLAKPTDAPDYPVLRGPSATRASVPIVEVLGVGGSQRVHVMRANNARAVGTRIGSGHVQLAGLTEDGTYELKALCGSASSRPLTLTVDRSASPPKLTMKSNQASAECEAGSAFELWWGLEGVPVAAIGGGQADKDGLVTVPIGDDLPGWTVTGFEGSRFDRQVFVASWAKIDRNFEGGQADERLPGDEFALRFEGLLEVRQPGDYRFELNSDDGSRLWIDGELAVNNWGHHGMSARSAVVPLDRGLHTARIDYYEEDGWAGIQFRYAAPGGELTGDVPVRRAPQPAKELQFFGVQTDRLGNRSGFSPPAP